MKYKIRKLSNLKRRNFFDTYEPEKRKSFSKTDTLPFLLRVGNRLAFVGGWISFWAVSGLMLIRGFFGFKKNIHRFDLNKRVVELRIKGRR